MQNKNTNTSGFTRNQKDENNEIFKRVGVSIEIIWWDCFKLLRMSGY